MNEHEHRELLRKSQETDRLLKETSDVLGGVRYEDLPRVLRRIKDGHAARGDELARLRKELGAKE